MCDLPTGHRVDGVECLREKVGKTWQGERASWLQQVFQLARVQAVIMSLWSISDVKMVASMAGLYWSSKAAEGETALLHGVASVQLQVRWDLNAAAHPHLWGILVIVGGAE
jgi:hypothetical protein